MNAVALLLKTVQFCGSLFAECQTELTTADLALLEDMLHPRCSTPLPIDDSCDESYGFVDNSQDCTYEPTLHDSSL